MIVTLATKQNPLKKPWLEGGPKKNTEMKRHTVGCWLLTEQLRPASLRGSKEGEEEERSLARPLAPYSVPLLLCDSPFLACLQLRDSCVNSALLSHHIAKREDAVFLMPFTAPDLVLSGVREPQIIVIIVVVSCL
jgi:hypothetical protein